MIYKMAPMEGLTDSCFRQIHVQHFAPADVYYTPFLSPTQQHLLTHKEKREVDPANNRGMHVIPQILSRVAEDFLWAAEELKAMGYTEVNLNLGCPSGTVVKKMKGSGLLGDLILLDLFLHEIFSKSPLPISIKTRTGLKDNSSFPEILKIYNQYPVRELIVHPRYQAQMYRGIPDRKAWEHALEFSRIPLCYNGDILDRSSFQTFVQQYPMTPAVMIGRGMIANPGLIGELRDRKPLSRETLRLYHQNLYLQTKERIRNMRQTLMHMKEYWFYMSGCFENSEKVFKAVRKAQSFAEYEPVTTMIFREAAMRTTPGFLPRD